MYVLPKHKGSTRDQRNKEHHLQAALSASQAAIIGGKVAQIYIPTPDAVQSSLQYDKLYPLTYAQPATYVRFSSTVEDCAGCPYDMDEEDQTFFKFMNKKKNASTQCSEDQFEEIVNCFEETAQVKQPFAAVDSPPVLSYDEIESSMDDYLDHHARPFAREVYEHWKARRLEAGNKPLITGLKVSRLPVHTGCNLQLTKSSSRQARIPMMPTPMSASEDEKSDRFGRLVAEMPIAPRSLRSSEKSSKSLGKSWL